MFGSHRNRLELLADLQNSDRLHAIADDVKRNPAGGDDYQKGLSVPTTSKGEPLKRASSEGSDSSIHNKEVDGRKKSKPLVGCEATIVKCLWIDADSSTKSGCTDINIETLHADLNAAALKWKDLTCPCVDEDGNPVEDKDRNKGCTVHVEFEINRDKKPPTGCASVVLHCGGSTPDPNAPSPGGGVTRVMDMHLDVAISDSTLAHELGHSLGIQGENYTFVVEGDRLKSIASIGFEGTMMGDPGAREQKPPTAEESCVIIHTLNQGGPSKSGNSKQKFCAEEMCCPTTQLMSLSNAVLRLPIPAIPGSQREEGGDGGGGAKMYDDNQWRSGILGWCHVTVGESQASIHVYPTVTHETHVSCSDRECDCDDECFA